MKIIIFRVTIYTCLILSYGVLFWYQEQRIQKQNMTLNLALPAKFYRIATGYGKQLVAEMLFIRTSVFLGDVPAGTPTESYESALANNLEVITRLYPHFLDPYYFCNGFLASISEDSAARAAGIFETGIDAYPEDIYLHFFYGTNFFLWMNEPLKAAKAFEEAAKIPDAPAMFQHLAAILSAQGGEIAAGLMSLKTMHAAEENEMVRARYEEEIAIFEQALEVQQALNAYIARFGSAPETLDRLVPKFIDRIPKINTSFVMDYSPPNLHLKRPARKYIK